MLTAQKLEKIIALEDNLRSQYQAQLDAKSAEIEKLLNEVESLTKKQEEQQTVIAKQLAQLTTQSAEASANKRVEQLNRELHNRCDNLTGEIDTQKKRIKELQKSLADERAEVKTLKQYDAVAMKKNLDANKKKLVEKAAANELMQKTLNKSKTENAELQAKVKELEAKLAALEPVAAEEPEVAAEAEVTAEAAAA
jgi:septal ring factor EnvC (AmiA/AmiB activator)